jgi:2-desacetyl-2-hydroxyethyl bacteriochlorophyllide A dehydrogenase
MSSRHDTQRIETLTGRPRLHHQGDVAMTTMRAAVLTGAETIAVQDVESPEPGPGRVIVRTRNCGICGSDLHFYRGEFPSPPGLRMGHEPSGEVAALSDDVTGLAVGQRVCIEPVEVCRECDFCSVGDYQLCPQRKFMGTMLPGAFAEYVDVPAYIVHPLPDNVDFEVGALVEPLAVAVHGLRQVGLRFGERVVVLGSGTIGLMAQIAARAMGASDVFATARYPHQIETARALGADRVVEANDGAVQELTTAFGARLPEVVVETVGGHGETLNQAISLIRPGGRVSVLGIFTDAPPVNATLAVLKEVSLVGGITYGLPDSRSDFQIALEIASRHVEDMRRLITHRVSLEEIASGFVTANDKAQRSIKVTVEV